MRQWVVMFVLICSSVAAHAQTKARAEQYSDYWELGLRVGGAITDDSYSLDGNVETLTLLHTMGPRRAVEFELSADQLDFGIDYGLKHTSFAINYLEINREPLWDPYLLVGAGMIQFDAPAADGHGSSAILQAAVGGSWELVASGKLLFRADVRVRYDLTDSDQPGQEGFGDAIVTFGLSMPFGR